MNDSWLKQGRHWGLSEHLGLADAILFSSFQKRWRDEALWHPTFCPVCVLFVPTLVNLTLPPPRALAYLNNK